MSDDTRCDWCLRPLAPEGREYDDTDHPDRYCWSDGDALCEEVHELDAWPRVRADLARIQAQLAEAREEIATLRATLGTLPAVSVLSPLSVYPVAVAVGEPYPVCPRCSRLATHCSCGARESSPSPAPSLSVQRRHAAQGRPDPLVCPACGCAWPELTVGVEDTVTCACGRVLGCSSRRRL